MIGLRLLFFVLLPVAVPAYSAPDLPRGLVISLLHQGEWVLHAVADPGTGLQPLATATEARTPAISRDGLRLAYVTASGALRERNLNTGRERVVAEASGQRGLTQPAWDSKSHGWVAVWLKDGTSVDTDIVHSFSSEPRALLAQRSAQFDPHLRGDTLYYGNVHCTIACGHIIQEIWRYDRVTGQARQLTLLNAVSRQPATDSASALYFSSNHLGYYHIWRLDPAVAEPNPVTSGVVSDSAPAPASDGSVYFLRRSAGGTRLMRLTASGDVLAIDLDLEYEDLKDLRIPAP